MTKSAVRKLTHQIEDAAEEIGHDARRAGKRILREARDLAEDGRGATGEFVRQAGEGASRLTSQAAEVVRRHPRTTAAIAVGLVAVITRIFLRRKAR